MKDIFISLLLLVILTGFCRGQSQANLREGVVSFKSSQNIYVKFESTKGIEIGDTLFLTEPDHSNLIPVVEIKHISSISCVGTMLTSRQVNVTDVLIFKIRMTLPTVNDEVTPQKTRNISAITKTELISRPYKLKDDFSQQQKIRGRLAVGSYSYFSNTDAPSTQRMRYTFSLRADNIANSRFSAESYVIFRHKSHEWDEVKANLASALKVYSMAIKYQPDDRSQVLIGRKINSHISNIGAIDGLQAERRFGDITLGAIVGTRPSRQDYSLDMHLFEFGGFVSHEKTTKVGHVQSSLALMEQKNHGVTDRRFAYFQHNNSLVKNLNLFWSMELDLYKLENEKRTNTLRPTSAYISLRYRASRKLSLSASFDRRNNVIYYESYKSFIDQLIEQETRQGMRLRFNYRPIKYVTLGSSFGYRSQKNNPNTSKNLYSFLTFSGIPVVNMSATLTSTLIQTSYLNGGIYGLRLSKDLFKGKLFSELNLRSVRYQYGTSDATLKQFIAGMNFSWRLKKKTSLSLNYEGTFEKSRTLNRIYANIIQRL